jgi:hypothetical protein
MRRNYHRKLSASIYHHAKNLGIIGILVYPKIRQITHYIICIVTEFKISSSYTIKIIAKSPLGMWIFIIYFTINKYSNDTLITIYYVQKLGQSLFLSLEYFIRFNNLFLYCIIVACFLFIL